MPITGARCHLEQASIGSLCFVSCRTTCFSSSTQHPVPVLLCCDSLGVSAQLCTTTWSSSTGPWAPQQTMGTECLLCHQLQLFPARPQSPGCAGPVLRAPQQPQQPWAVPLAMTVAVWGYRGCQALQEALMLPAAQAEGFAIAFPTSSFVWRRRRAGLVGLEKGPSPCQCAWGDLFPVPGPVER